MNRNAALKVVTKQLEGEKPIILEDPQTGTHVLLLKEMTEFTLDKDTRDPVVLGELSDSAARYLKSIELALPFLHQNGLMTEDFEFTTMEIGGRRMAGLRIPDGIQATERLRRLYKEEQVPNPFVIITSLIDDGLVDEILKIQQIGQGKPR